MKMWIMLTILLSTPSISAMNIYDDTIVENKTLLSIKENPSDSTPGITIYGDNNIIRNCTIIGFYINILNKGKNNTIINNTLVGATDGIQLSNCKDCTIVGNYFQRNNYSIVCFNNSSYVSIEDNFFVESTRAAIDLRFTKDITIKDNVFNYNLYNYVYSDYPTTSNITITDNSYNNGTGNITTWDNLWMMFHYNPIPLITGLKNEIILLSNSLSFLLNTLFYFFVALCISITCCIYFLYKIKINNLKEEKI